MKSQIKKKEKKITQNSMVDIANADIYQPVISNDQNYQMIIKYKVMFMRMFCKANNMLHN